MPTNEMLREVIHDYKPLPDLTFSRSLFDKHDPLFFTTPQETYNLLELHYNFFSTHPEVREKYRDFTKKVIANYPKEESLYILRGLMLATVAHQYNLTTDKRYRKEKDPRTKKPIPYIYHSMEMAERLIDEKDKSKIPFAWWIVTAALLHDVPEDVDLGNGRKTKADWFRIIEESFDNTSKGKAIANVVRAVTNPERPKKWSNWIDLKLEIKENPLYKMILAHLEKGGLKGSRSRSRKPNPITETDKEKLYDVVYAFQHTMDAALSLPEYVAAITLKIVDGWHNFQSPEHIREVKILRGRMFAALSEWLGWYSMRNELIFQTAGITDTNTPYLPGTEDKWMYYPRESDRETGHLRQPAEDVIKSLSECYEEFQFLEGLDLKELKIFTGYPYITSGHKLPNLTYEEFKLTLPLPEVVVLLDKERMTELVELKEFHPDHFNVRSQKDKTKIASLEPLDLGIGDCVTMFGRNRVDYSVKIDNKLSFILRIEDGSLPYILDAFKQSSEMSIDQAPEYALFHHDLYGTDYWSFHRNALLGFLYEPNLPIQAGSEVYPVFYKGKLYFLPGEMKVNNLHKLLSMPMSVKYYETKRSTTPQLIDKHILRLNELSEGSGVKKTFLGRLLIFEDEVISDNPTG